MRFFISFTFPGQIHVGMEWTQTLQTGATEIWCKCNSLWSCYIQREEMQQPSSIPLNHSNSFPLPPKLYRLHSLNIKTLNPLCNGIRHENCYANRVKCLSNAINKSSISESQIDPTTGRTLEAEAVFQDMVSSAKAKSV
ncbi:hypothetical protein Hdeb2414_s0013g00404401 [Helianthus debilis subsp. tardiflorus]